MSGSDELTIDRLLALAKGFPPPPPKRCIFMSPEKAGELRRLIPDVDIVFTIHVSEYLRGVERESGQFGVQFYDGDPTRCPRCQTPEDVAREIEVHSPTFFGG